MRLPSVCLPYCLTIALIGLLLLVSPQAYPLPLHTATLEIQLNPHTGRTGEQNQLTATLQSTDTTVDLSGKTVTFSIDGVALGSAETDATGNVTLPFTFEENFDIGAHSLTAHFAGDADTDAADATSTFTAKQAPTTLKPTGAMGSMGETVTFSVLLTRATDGKALSGKTVRFLLEREEVGTITTDSSGFANISYTIPRTLTKIKSPLTVQFDGDTHHLNNRDSSASLTLRQLKTTLALTAVTGRPGDTKTLTATLQSLESNVLIGKVSIVFMLDDVRIGTATTNTEGKATLTYALTDSLGVGGHPLKAVFAGDLRFTPSENTAPLTLKPSPTRLVQSSVAGKSGSTTQLIVTLTRTTDNTVLKGKKIRYWIDGKEIGITITRADGTATLPYTLPTTSKKETLHLSTLFEGEPLYTSSGDKNAVLTVKP